MDASGGDLSRLSDLNVESILKHLKSRFLKDKIYSRCGDILISVNPYKTIGIYDKQHHDKYHWKNIVSTQEPHIFATTALAFQRLQETKTDQVILVSGESGAGKTETTKYVIKHLVEMCGNSQGDLHTKILRINPLMESLGNARTNLNQNSSRFAKFIQINFGSDGLIQGAFVRDYLLEKSRVILQPRGERNFHIFYALLSGIDSKMREYLCLDDRDFRIVKGCSRNGEDHKQYTKYVEIMKLIGLTTQDIQAVQIILAAIIHVTELTFEANDSQSMGVVVSNEDDMINAAGLLGIDVNEFGKALVSENVKFSGEEITTLKTIEQAEDGRDALAKAIYERLFGWMIRNINLSLQSHHNLGSAGIGSLGILDICGFEIMQKNGLEQLCINLVNEQLQGFMNDQVFKREQDIYEAEGLTLEKINYPDNKHVLEMFNKTKVGIMNLIDEDTKLAQATNISMVQKISKMWSHHEHFKCPKYNTPEFGILHFAGEVTYDASNFIEKNGDNLSSDLIKCIVASTNDLISDLFQVKRSLTGSISTQQYNYRQSITNRVKVLPTARGFTRTTVNNLRQSTKYRGNNKTTLGKNLKDHKTQLSFFMASIKDLLQKMNSAEPLFVRCIKPNTKQQENLFTDEKVREQLNYLGVKQIVTIRRLCFPVRRTYDDFFESYRRLMTNCEMSGEITNKCKMILERFFDIGSDYSYGKTQIFMVESVTQTLEAIVRLQEHQHKRRIKRHVQIWKTEIIKRKLQRQLDAERALQRQRDEESELIMQRDKESEIQRMMDEEKELQRKKDEEEERQRKMNAEKELQRKKDEEELQRKKDEQKELHRKMGREDKEKTFMKTRFGLDVMDLETIPEVQTPASQINASDYNIPTTFLSNSTISNHRDKDIHNETEENYDHFFQNCVDDDDDDEDDNDDDDDADEIMFWDPFDTVHREPPSSDTSKNIILQGIRVVLYVFLFLLLISCCISQKLSLIISIANFPRESTQLQVDTKTVYLMNCIVAICIPYALNMVVSAFKILFGKFSRPSLMTLLVAVFTELLHTFGLCLLILGVLPNHNILLSLLLLSAVAIVPSILHLVASTHQVNKSTNITTCVDSICGRVISYMLDGVCILVQGSVVVIMILWFYEDEYTRIDTIHAKTPFKYAEFVCGFICVSFGWWENFLDDRFLFQLSQMNRMKNLFLSIRYDLQEGRYYVVMVAHLLKILLTLAMVYLYYPRMFDYELLTNLGENMYTSDNTVLIPLITLHISPLIACYIGTLACKLQMQIVSFSLPLILATPGAILIAYMHCKYHFINEWLNTYDICESPDSVISDPKLAVGAVWYISLLWITRHIWFPRQERLALFDRMFVNPLYCTMLTTESFILNRRRHMRQVQIRDIKKEGKGGIYYKLAKMEGESDSTMISDTESTYTQYEKDTHNVEVPVIYACATMWHETRTEMVQLLKSLHRIDAEQWCRRKTIEISEVYDPDFFNYEAHIFVDDVMEQNDDEEWQVNQFVVRLVECMEEAMSSVHNTPLKPHPPIKIPTPYGGQLLYKMPGGNLLYVHLKDKNKIRHRKRWSQVMYMYYLLGFKLLKDCEELTMEAFKDENRRMKKNWKSSRDFQKYMSEETQIQSENTFILALDGDTDFSPVAVRLLLDRMKKNDKAAAACGRIHPIGSGPVIWFQKFEYAIGHWLQKATEHVIGCVLCSPGCFSLFRGSALMDRNVMNKYTTIPTEPRQFVQYDQGEDRWLCTLLLQQGYRVDYAAAADAFTYAPDTFNELFNQRRRWMPSTLANIIDLLGDYKNTVAINNNISFLYILYQVALVISTVLGPATVIMMIASAFSEVFGFDIWLSYGLSLGPAVAYVIICLTTKSKTQLLIAALLSTLYGFVMMVVLAAIIITAGKKPVLDPSILFICGIVALFVITALMHPYEIYCLPWGVLYFMCIPSGYLLLVIYSMCNLDNISWGTREIPKKKTKAEMSAEQKAAKEKKQGRGVFSNIFLNKDILSFGNRSTHDPLLEEVKTMTKSIKDLLGKKSEEIKDTNIEAEGATASSIPVNTEPAKNPINEHKKKPSTIRYDLNEPFWISDPRLGLGTVGKLDESEHTFWKDFIKKYLTPLNKDKETEKHVNASLVTLRNNIVYAMAMANLLWIGINFVLQYQPTATTTIRIKYRNDSISVDLLALLFIALFALILFMQFFGMLKHRWGTFLHLISITELRTDNLSKSKYEQIIELYNEMNEVPKPIAGIGHTTPPDMNPRGVPINKSLRATSKPQIQVGFNPVMAKNLRKTDRYRTRPLPSLNQNLTQTILGDVKKTRKNEIVLRQPASTGFNLRKTTKGILKRAQEAGITFESNDSTEPECDYDDDPLYDFLKEDNNAMSRQFARQFKQQNRV